MIPFLGQHVVGVVAQVRASPATVLVESEPSQRATTGSWMDASIDIHGAPVPRLDLVGQVGWNDSSIDLSWATLH
jgi:hypothetical protein